ncbi:family 1 glycosylhydrolase [Streptomyces sp. NPDC050523]|uniref:family 1 glycosylhydrolase n=1 Tax=Streptomyces sp. NPDC050523 TaxID=3365622 RepID=UPI00378F3C86
MGWGIDADGLLSLLTRIQSGYPGVPLVITENGAALRTWCMTGTRCTIRSGWQWHTWPATWQWLTMRFAQACPWRASSSGRWIFGYTKRFRLVHVDFETQQWRLKEGAYWYREVIAANALPG